MVVERDAGCPLADIVYLPFAALAGEMCLRAYDLGAAPRVGLFIKWKMDFARLLTTDEGALLQHNEILTKKRKRSMGYVVARQHGL